jgi:hypothetical protein
VRLKWEALDSEPRTAMTERARVPGGWLVRQWPKSIGAVKGQNEKDAIAITFVPDPAGAWADQAGGAATE